MGNLRDIAGNIYGDWKVIKFDDTKGKYKYYWICECINCKKIESIITSSLLNGKSTKCKCNKKYKIPENIRGYEENLSGKTFGSLEVLKYSHKEHSHSHWICKCICGNEIIKSISYLKQSKYKMCDDCRKELKDFAKQEKLKEIKSKLPIKVPAAKKENSYEFINDCVLINGIAKIDIEDLDKVDKLNRYWYKNKSGYVLATYFDVDIFLHRFIMGLPNRYDNETKLIVDHINGDRSDNRKSNMRIITKNQNPINCKTYSNNTSGTKGVCWNKKLGKWNAYLHINGKRFYLGVYENIEDAIKIRKKYEETHFGDMKRDEAVD